MKVTFLTPSPVDATILYQRYYLMGLADVAAVELAAAPLRTALRRDIPAKVGLLNPSRSLRLLRRLGRRPAAPTRGAHVARYVLETGGIQVPFAIDARDNHVVDPGPDLAWAQVYFKANMWPDAAYASHVRPIVNGNGLLTPQRIARLRALRAVPKRVDVAFISNVWAGREHNIRLLEELARLENADLEAVFPDQPGVAEEDTAFAARLRRVGVGSRRRPIPLHVLWRRLAAARVVVIRSGKHLCIPWRMLDLLGMGSCILFDAPPLPRWPVPLQQDQEYASIGIDRPPWEPVAEQEYAKVVPAVAELVRDEARRSRLAAGAAEYFERHAAPQRVGDYILTNVAPRAS